MSDSFVWPLNSSFMPGSKGDYAKLLSELNEGVVSREQLKYNAAYLIREAIRLKG